MTDSHTLPFSVPVDIWYIVISLADIHTLTQTLAPVSKLFQELVNRHITLTHNRRFVLANQQVILSMRHINFAALFASTSITHTYNLAFTEYASGRLKFTPSYKGSFELTTMTLPSSSRQELALVHTLPTRPQLHLGSLMQFEILLVRFVEIDRKAGGVERIERVLGEIEAVAPVVNLPGFTLHFDECCHLFTNADFCMLDFAY